MPTENVPQKRFGEIALCLSGGGYRAATFALGTLDMLDELHLLDDVKLLSTVSGGTFTGLNYAVSQSEKKTFGEFYENYGNFLKRTNVIDKALEKLYKTPSPSGSTDVSLIRSAAYFYSSKRFLSTRIFSELTSIVGENARFKELIFNATEFREGNGFRFRASWDEDIFIGNQIFSVPKDVAAEIRLADIVASSSCFPGAFEPIRFPDDFYWVSPLKAIRAKLIQDVIPPYPPNKPYTNGFNVDGKCIPLPLMDGGVFDNQGITSAVLADKLKTFQLFLISDTSPREDDILDDPDESPRRGWFTLETLFWLAVGLFILGVVAVGILVYLFFGGEPQNFTPFEQYLAFGVSIVPAILLIGVLLWAYRQFSAIKSITVSKAKFRLWRYFKHIALPDAIQMVKVRVNSVLAMTADIFMKRIRQLQFNNLMNPESRREKVTFNLIYSIAAAPEHSVLWILDPELKPTDKMKSISGRAEEMPTTLWMTDDEDFPTLIACGRCTTCFSLLKHLWRRWQAEEEKAQNHIPPFHVPKPNDPASDYYEIYTLLKAKWLELKKNPYDGQDRERV